MAKIPINIVTGSIQRDELIVGIDLGTTNSLIAAIHPDTKQPFILKEFDNSSMVPSVVHIEANGNIVVGEAARALAEQAPDRTISSVKRLMGKSYADVAQDQAYFSFDLVDHGDALVGIQVGDQVYNPIQISSFILQELKTRAEHILKYPIEKCVITVPAYFNDAQRQATKDAAALAGLQVLRIVNEPTAASLAYGLGLDKHESKTIAVYDFGGGTFDISILKVENGIFEVLSTNGDTYLGGDDVDHLVAEYFLAQDDPSQKQNFQFYKTLAEQAKIILSDAEAFSSGIFSISRVQFDELVKGLVQRTLDCCKKALYDAELSSKDINAVVMVGGSTKIPIVKTMVAQFFKQSLNDSLHPHEVVALGAAVQADILSGDNTEMLLLDVTPLSLGVETMGGLMDVLIPRNSKIPNLAARQYTTQKDGQTAIKIAVYQGERDEVMHNRKLAEFELKGIPAMPAGLAKVEIKFRIDADGILTVSAQELRSGIQQQTIVRPQFGINDEDVERMLMESLQFAKDDIATRALLEVKNEAEHMISLTENFIYKNEALLSASEIQATKQAIEDLNQSLLSKQKDQIQQRIEQLNAISQPYAERIMDIAVSNALKGNKV